VTDFESKHDDISFFRFGSGDRDGALPPVQFMEMTRSPWADLVIAGLSG